MQFTNVRTGIECRNPEKTDEGLVSVLSKDASNSAELRVSEDGFKTMFKVLNYLNQKEVNNVDYSPKQLNDK